MPIKKQTPSWRKFSSFHHEIPGEFFDENDVDTFLPQHF